MNGPDDLVRDLGPPYVVEAAGTLPNGWPWRLIRKRYGSRVRVVVPDIFATDAQIETAVVVAVGRLPEPPGYWTV